MANRTATFTSSGAAITISTAAQTNASGITSATYKSTLAQNANILVAVDGLSFVAPIIFVPGPVASTKSTIVLTPNKVVADGMTQTSILITSRDAQNNIDPNVAVSLTASGGNTTIANPSGVTNASGQYSTTMTSTQAQAQVETISAALNSNVTITASMTFVAGPANTTFSTLTTARYQTLANNSNVVTASLYLADIDNNPISGQTPVWSISGTGMTTVASCATSSAGIATAPFRTGTVQNANITANANGITEMTTAHFVPNPNACVMTLDTNTQVADGNSPINISVFITDANQTAMSNHPVSFVVSGSTGPLASTALRTNASGYVSNTLKSFTKGPSLITARAGNTRCTAQINFTQRASFCSGNPNYTASRLVTTSAVNSFAQGDMNNDGLIDVVTVNANSTLNVYLGTGSGTFGPVANPNTGTSLFSISSGDLTGDGIIDLVVQANTKQLLTYPCTSSGTFSAYNTYTTTHNAGSIAISDLNRDGYQDMMFNTGGNGLDIWLYSSCK